MSCPHIASTRKINLKDMSKLNEEQCDECSNKVADVWMCMQSCCSFVGCGSYSKNHIGSHHQETDHAIYMSKNNQQVWCFGCGRKLDEVKLVFSQDTADSDEMEEQSDSDDNHTVDMEEEAAMIDKDYFDGFEKGMKPRGLTGLTNIGNTCYMNSALQALSNSPSLMQFFLECPGYVDQPQANLSKHYRTLVTEMWSKKRPKFVTPSEFLQCFQKLNPQFRGYRQQDAQEFLRVLMDLLHEELKEPVPPAVTREDKPPRKPANRLPTRSKRLLGGKADGQSGELVQNGLKKSRTNRYNLRSFSRRKAEALKTNQSKQDLKNPVQENDVATNHTLLSNSYSCPELREEVASSGTVSSSAEPKEPALSIGVVNMASDSFETEDGCDERNSSYERSISDSEINYYELGDGGSEQQGSSEQKPAAVEFSSIISNLFNGKIRSSVQCLTCKKISSTMETFQDLSLPIPGKEELSAIHSTTQCNPIMSSYSSRGSQRGLIGTIFDWFSSWIFGPRVSFEDCLAAFFSADELKGDNMYRCEHCSMLRNGIKECRVYKLPEMLCIHLKRFRHEFYHSSKISSFISFPLEALDVRKYLTSDFSGKCTKYDLVAIITHHGSVGGGHYVAYCKNFITGKWYEFNDSYVSEVSASYVQSCEAYVLFYRKRGESVTKNRQKFFRLSKNSEGQPATHYISKKWMTMFYTCAEPGPISNNSFTCQHGAIDPIQESFLSDLVTPLQQTCWDFLMKKFGGGPEVKDLNICPICEKELEELEKRRTYEFDTLKEIFENSESSAPQYFISLKWFKEWKNFVDGMNKDPPGPINNHRIGLQRKRVPKAAWDFLHSVYGGKPALPVDETQR